MHYLHDTYYGYNINIYKYNNIMYTYTQLKFSYNFNTLSNYIHNLYVHGNGKQRLNKTNKKKKTATIILYKK